MFLTAFMATVLTAVIVYAMVSYEFRKAMDDVSGYISLSTSTKHEEDSENIKNDLVLSSYEVDQWKYIKMIKNTSENCCLDAVSLLQNVFILSCNSGTISELGIDNETYGGSSTAFSYDEVSGLNVIVSRVALEKIEASLIRDKDVISIHRLKKIYCDDCIKKILDTIAGQEIVEALIYDPDSKEFLAIKPGEWNIGKYRIKVFLEKDKTYSLEVEA